MAAKTSQPDSTPDSADGSTPTPTPTPTPTLLPTPTGNLSPEPSLDPTPASTFTPTPTGTFSPEPSPDLTPDPTPASTFTPTPTPIPTPTSTPIPTPTPTSLPGDLIINMDCYDSINADEWSVRTNIQEGNRLYGDRFYDISLLPSSYEGSNWIRTANDSKSYSDDPLVTFTVTQDAYVYVVFDDRITIPDWLSSWTDTGDNLIDTQPICFSIYSKFYAENSQASLGSIGCSSGCCGYIIIVKNSG